jgi:uncharacterized membrane protein
VNARHPLHPAIVHFPIACWSLSVAADFASQWYGEAAWQWSGGLLAIGCAMALPAMIAGLVELPRVPEGSALRDTWMHMGCMLAAFSCFAVRLLLRLDHLQPLAPNGLSLSLDVCGFLALTLGGWMGGRLVYGHGVGRA